MRLYGGGSVLVRREPDDLKPGAFEYGLELYSPWHLAWGIRPVAAVDLQNRQENNWAVDISARAGLEFGGVQVLGRKLLIALEYFNGHSPNGQFYRDRVNYFGIGAHLVLTRRGALAPFRTSPRKAGCAGEARARSGPPGSRRLRTAASRR